MAVKTTQAGDIISHTQGQPNKEKAGWERWLPPAVFMGFSGFVIATELAEWLQTAPLIKLILGLLAGVVGALATTHTALFRQGRGK